MGLELRRTCSLRFVTETVQFFMFVAGTAGVAGTFD